MDAGPVTTHKRPPSWKLAPEVAADTQGIVATGFGQLQTGRLLMLYFDWAPESGTHGAWLTALRQVAPITSAEPPAEGENRPRSAALGISWAGLQLMGLSDTTLTSFSKPFQEGMMQEDRLRRLGDRRGGKWQTSVIDSGPQWSANTPDRPPIEPLPVGFYVPDATTKEDVIVTPLTVHAVLFLYGRNETDVDEWAADVVKTLAPFGVTKVHERELVLDVIGQDQFAREHFGFADGLSQPVPFDKKKNVHLGGQPAVEPHDPQGVPLGEFLFGYVNGHGEIAPGPVVPDNTGSLRKLPDPRQAGLQEFDDARGFFDFGRNGSYMVVRELKQDVAAFWNSMEANAQRLKQQDPVHLAHITAEWLAERVMGRDINGNLLCPGGVLPPKDGFPDNDFLFWERDQYGQGCPLGSHVRRAHPRDGLAPGETHRKDLLKSANNHRILRRGRKFGAAITDRHMDDGADRGLMFVCLNTDIARQFEFIQQTWLFNSSFATLFQEVDPLIGPDGPMTVHAKQDDPLRLIVHVETYVHMAGGDYFFLPSLPALNYLEQL